MGVPVEEALNDIRVNSREVVIHLDCDGNKSWMSSLGKLFPTQSLDLRLDWMTNPPSGEELPKIDWLVVLFPITNKNYSWTDPDIRSWGKPVK